MLCALAGSSQDRVEELPWAFWRELRDFLAGIKKKEKKEKREEKEREREREKEREREREAERSDGLPLTWYRKCVPP